MIAMSTSLTFASYLMPPAPPSPVELAACFLQGLHQLPGALLDLDESVVGTEELGTEAEAGRTRAEPAGDILDADATDGKHTDIRRPPRPPRCQRRGFVGHRRELLDVAGAGVNVATCFRGGCEAWHLFHAKLQGAADD